MLKGGADVRCHWLSAIGKDGSVSLFRYGGVRCLKSINVMGSPWNSMLYLSTPLSFYHTACATIRLITVLAKS
jgi:hypothetical protein